MSGAAPRIVIAGGPRVGKTTLAIRMGHELGVVPRHTDDLIGKLPWSEDSAEVARWFEAPGPWVVEGATAARALRKWMASHPEGRPADLVLLLTEPMVEQTSGQRGMAKGVRTVWRGIVDELRARGVDVMEGAAPALDVVAKAS